MWAVSLSNAAAMKQPDLFQHSLRCDIARLHDGDNLIEAEFVKTIFKARLRRFGGKPHAPVRFCQPVSDFNFASDSARHFSMEAV